jgi:hypothetical protein
LIGGVVNVSAAQMAAVGDIYLTNLHSGPPGKVSMP